jgi:hypothetical protein
MTTVDPSRFDPPSFKCSLGSYRLYAYLENADGSKTELSPETLDKITNLATGLLKAHEFKLNTTIEQCRIDRAGLSITDGALYSHNFAIHPLDSALAISLCEKIDFQNVSALKAQDVWSAIEQLGIDSICRPTSSTSAALLEPMEIETPQSASPVATTPPLQAAPPKIEEGKAPIAAAPPQPKRLRLNHDRIPFVSYIDQLDSSEWEKLSIPERRDAARHAHHFPGFPGKAEEYARALCRSKVSELEYLLKTLTDQAATLPTTNGLDRSLNEEGEAILNLYYLNADIQNILVARQRLKKLIPILPEEKKQLYYRYILSLAKAASILIESDEDFSKTYWNHIQLTPHSMQALSRLLHSS